MSVPVSISIEFTAEAQAALARFSQLPKNVLLGIARGMKEANQNTIGVIQRDFLSFPKGQPPTLEGLRVQSNRLRGSVRASDPVISGNSVTSTIGSNVKYAALHEFGGVVKRVLIAGSVRLRTDKRGNLLRQGKNGKLAVFAKANHKQATTVAYVGGKRFEAHYPERAPFRRGIAKNMENIKTIVSRHVLAAVGNGGQP